LWLQLVDVRWILAVHSAALAQVPVLAAWRSAAGELAAGDERDLLRASALGVFHRLWKSQLKRYDGRRGIAWRWQSVDGAMTKAPLGGEKNREKPRL
jgi:hypothetical protein